MVALIDVIGTSMHMFIVGHQVRINCAIKACNSRVNHIGPDFNFNKTATFLILCGLVQAKANSKSEGNPMQENMEDISWIRDMMTSTCYGGSSDISIDFLSPPSTTANLIFCTFLFLNILILLFTMLYLGEVYSWIEQPQHKILKDLYKASAIVLTFINFAGLITDAFEMVPEFLLNDSNVYLIMKLFLIVLIFILDIFISCFYTFKCGHKHRIMHALALCQIAWFVHRLATDTIISVIAFIIAPAQTLGAATLFLSTIACAILFVSTLLKKCQAFQCNRNCCTCTSDTLSAIFCTFPIAVCTVGLIFTITLLFIALIDNGLHSTGMGGFILSLIPPTAIFVIGLCVNRDVTVKFYHKVLASSTTGSANMNVTESDTPPHGNVNETSPLIQRSVAIDMEESAEEH